MSQLTDEPLDNQESGTVPEENEAENETSETSSQEAADETAEETPATAQDKFHAIKSALQKQEEERQQEETRIQIADKIQKMRTAKDEPAAGETPEQTSPKKKKKKGGKGKKKRKRSLGKRALELFPQKGDSVFEVIRKTVFLMSTTVFIACLVLIGDYFWESYKAKNTWDEIRDAVQRVKMEKPDPPEISMGSYESYIMKPEAEVLYKQNPDVVGYLSIPNTLIAYPVLQRKNEADGNEYYLNKDFYGNPSKSGAIFMDYRNYFDYVVDFKRIYPNSQNLIIYGHNMHDYSMFGSLKYYINDVSYYDAHPIVELSSNYRDYKYKIFGMIIVDIDDETETRFDYWNKLNFSGEEDFYDYVNEIKRRTVRLTDVDVKYGDQLLTLSTCNSTFSEGRLVIFARLLRDGEDLMEGCTSTENTNIKWPNSYYKWRKKTYDPDAEFIPYG